MEESTNLFESFFYANSSVMLLIDSKTGQIQNANDAACHYYGWDYTELCKKNISEISMLTRDTLTAELQNASTKAKNHFYFKHRLSSGEIRDVEVFSSVNYSNHTNLLLNIIHDITDQKKAEENLKKNEEKFRCIVESSPIAKYIYRLESNNELVLVGANPSADRIIGISHLELLGKPIEKAFPELASTEVPELYRQIAKGTLGTQTFEIAYSDSRFSGFYSVTVFQTGTNNIVVDFIDISEQKKIAESLRENEEKYRLLHENAGIGIGYYTPNGVILSFNRSAASYMNGVPEDFIGKSIYDLFSETDADSYQSRISAACTSEIPMVYEDYVQLPSGDKYFLSTYTKITNTDKKILGIQIISQDITELKLNSNSLIESESRFRSFFEDSSVGSVFVGLDQRFLRCNPAFCSFLGYDNAELCTKTISDVTYPEDCDIGLKELPQIVAGSLSHYIAEKRYVRKDGKVVWGEVSISLVRDAADKPMYFLPIIIDIDNRKKNEEENRKYEQQLQQSQRLESLGLLAGGIAHDFNNLLGGIYGYIDMAGEYTSDDKYVRYLSKAMNTIERARGLTLQLLTFSKGGDPLKKTGNLFPFVQETVQFALSGSNVLCAFDIQSDLYICDFDKNQIGQVVDNIVINAIQAMPDGGMISITARNIQVHDNKKPPLTSGNYVQISIKDSGIGIPKNILPRIFDPFFTTKPTGHGLGLATCFSIIKRHSGCIDVETTPGIGTTFHIFLPALKTSIATNKESASRVHKGSGVFLIMDDQEIMRDTISEMLNSLGYETVCRKDGTEVIKFVQSEINENRAIAGIILDITIPGGMGGKETVVEIRKLNQKVPVFVTSGYAEDPIMSNPQKFGFIASICKPFRKSELSEMLHTYL